MAFGAALARLNTTVLRTFAEVVVVRAGYPAFAGVFDHRSAEFDALADMPGDARGMFSGPVPVLTVADAQVNGLRPGEGLAVNGTAYTVRDLRPDGHGLTVITLRLA